MERNTPAHGVTGFSQHKKIYLHTKTERLWHFSHAVAIVFLALTGFRIHFPQEFNIPLSIKTAIIIHNLLGTFVAAGFILWLGYILAARRSIYYLPVKRDLGKGIIAQIKFYASDIFKGEPHPFAASVEQKFNPLQKWSYIAVMFVMVPLLIASGFFILFCEKFQFVKLKPSGLCIVAVGHTILAYFTVAFLVVHLYLGTTGATIFDGFISMITGYAVEEESAEEKEKPYRTSYE